MNSKFAYKITRGMAVLLLLVFAVNVYGKDDKDPYLNIYTGLTGGYMELGPEFGKGNFVIRPLLRFPLTDKKDSKTQLDRDIASWSAILDVQLDFDRTKETGPAKHFTLDLQAEWGISRFSFYPDGNKENKQREWKQSISFEVRGMFFYGAESGNGSEKYGKQFVPQFRIRYSRIWKKSNEIGVVVPSSSGDPDSVIDLIIDPPKSTPVFSIAFALPYYPGKKKLSFTPGLYYSFRGNQNGKNPFGNVGRLRVETWLYYWGAKSVRIGISPYLSYRTHGEEKIDRLLYGVVVQLKFGGANFLRFL